jgi:hypothetical protein
MRPLPLIVLVAVGCPPKPASPEIPVEVFDIPAPPPAPPRPTAAPARGVTPYDAGLVTPSLTSSKEHFDLGTLVTRTVSYALPLDLGALSTVSAEDAAAALAPDPRWRVGVEHATVVATRRRDLPEGAHTTSRTGYHRDESGVWRVALRLGPWTDGDPWADAPMVSRVGADAPRVQLEGHALEGAGFHGLTGTALAVEGTEVGLTVFEAGPDDERRHTEAALGEIAPLVRDIVRSAATVRADGFDPLALPRGEPEAGLPSIAIGLLPDGTLEVRARVNPGRPGFIWMRFLDTRGRPWEEATWAESTVERVGWSRDASAKFYAQSAVPVPPGPGFSGSVEIWFQALDGREPERLGAFLARIPTR